MDHFVNLRKDTTRTKWTRVVGDTFAVEDVLNYTSVTINLRKLGNSSMKTRIENYNRTFNVTLFQAEVGDATNISWTISHFPSAGWYEIYHSYYGEVETIMMIFNERRPLRNSYKYIYHSRPFNSLNIQFEVKNISRKDCGYYFGGTIEAQSSSTQAVVLLVQGKPTVPVITGDMQVKKGNNASFTCHSKSTSTPGYYKKFPPLSYTWYIDNTEMIGYTTETYTFLATKNYEQSVISCRAKETLESARSKEIVIDILYGPEDINISPAVPSGEIYLHDGATFGPYNCTVDCNPPCRVQWMVKRSYGNFSYFANASSLEYTLATIPGQRVYRGNATLFLCVAYGSAFKNKSKSIKLDIQYLTQPKLCINGIAKNMSNVQENSTLELSCYVEGNPSPTIIFSKGSWKQVIRSFGNWLNYTFVKKAQCSDSNTYRCEGSSDAFPAKSKTLGFTVMCNPRLDDRMEIKLIYLIPNIPAVVSINVPIISYPIPKLLTWYSAFSNYGILTKINQRNDIYQHWVSSTIPVYNESFLGKYTLFGDEFELITIQISVQTIQIENSESQINILITVGVLGSLLLLVMTAIGVYKFLHRAEIPVSPGHPTPASRDVITSTKMNEGTHDDAMDAYERHEAPLDKKTSVDNERYKEIHGENIAVLPMYNQNITCIRDENNQYEELKP
ncbi:uncharacterized protein LOC133193191 [Saccostrea echinata]|uniref:uncharacterized protein LOC133193191 n=1 Tax=Saccostrea echinata TaxID=191078 RepID=UPI002A8363F6|nr:uncharacterized protein LOC133193191 [Saccostrea echinata]